NRFWQSLEIDYAQPLSSISSMQVRKSHLMQLQSLVLIELTVAHDHRPLLQFLHFVQIVHKLEAHFLQKMSRSAERKSADHYRLTLSPLQLKNAGSIVCQVVS